MKELVIISAFIVSNFSFGQEIHLSQFYTADQHLNPAMMGRHEGEWRFSANYRNQWKQINGAPLNTGMVAFDKVIHYYKKKINVGAFYARDQFSGFQTVTNKIYLTGAYGLDWLSCNWRGGFQAGLVTNSTDLSTQTFPTQWDYPNGQFNQSIYNGEANIRPSQLYLDINIGGVWSKKFEKFTLISGLAANHVNRPKDTYFSQVFQRRKMKGVFHTLAEIPLNSKFQLEPKMMWMWAAKANDFLFGSNARYFTNNKVISALHLGVFYRHGIKRTFDAVYPVFGLVYKRFDIGVSYDVNLSALSKGIKRVKTVEFSVIYTAPSRKVKYKIIPCDRY